MELESIENLQCCLVTIEIVHHYASTTNWQIV